MSRCRARFICLSNRSFGTNFLSLDKLTAFLCSIFKYFALLCSALFHCTPLRLTLLCLDITLLGWSVLYRSSLSRTKLYYAPLNKTVLCLDITLPSWTTPYFTTLNCSKPVCAMFGYNFAFLYFAVQYFTEHTALRFALLNYVWI